MGILTAFIYLTCFGVLCNISIALSIMLGDWGKASSKRENVVVASLGASGAVAITYCCIYLISQIEINNGWYSLFHQITISLLLPFTLGILTISIAKILKHIDVDEKPTSMINRFGCGMLHGVWLLPVTLIAYFVIPKLDDFAKWFTYEIAKIFI